MYIEGELLYDIRREMENESYPCKSCAGVGSLDVYINEYDLDEVTCTRCDGTGIVKGDED